MPGTRQVIQESVVVPFSAAYVTGAGLKRPLLTKELPKLTDHLALSLSKKWITASTLWNDSFAVSVASRE